MDPTPIGLFNAYDLQKDPHGYNRLPTQEVILYCEARFWRALPFIQNAEENRRGWMLETLVKELVSDILLPSVKAYFILRITAYLWLDYLRLSDSQ